GGGGGGLERVAVRAALGDEYLRAEAAQGAGHDRVEGPVPAGVAGTRRKRDVDRRPGGGGATGLGREAGTRKQRERCLVQADRHDPWIVVEDLLYPVAVVNVDVDVRDPLRAEVE